MDSLNVSVAAGLLCHAFVKEPVVETKYEPIEQNNETVESIEVDSITAVKAETKPVDQAQSESVSTSEQAENISEQVEETTEETEVTTKEEERPSEDKEKKVEGSNETMF